jgi:hypothetical protein
VLRLLSKRFHPFKIYICFSLSKVTKYYPYRLFLLAVEFAFHFMLVDTSCYSLSCNTFSCLCANGVVVCNRLIASFCRKFFQFCTSDYLKWTSIEYNLHFRDDYYAIVNSSSMLLKLYRLMDRHGTCLICASLVYLCQRDAFL